MPVFNNVLAGAAGQSGGAGDYTIERSLRFDPSSTSYLSKTPSSVGNRKKWTWSGWVKRGNTGANHILFSSGSGGTNARSILQFTTSDYIEFGENPTGSSWSAIYTAAKYRDPSAWYHIVAVYDSTNATSTDRLRLYVNGERVTSFSSTSYPSQDLEGNTNTTDEHRIGRYSAGNQTAYLDGYLADVHFLDGIAVSNPDGVFGEFSEDTGVWNPIQYTGDHNAPATGSNPTSTSGVAPSGSYGNTIPSAALLFSIGGPTNATSHIRQDGGGIEWSPAITLSGSDVAGVSCSYFNNASSSFDVEFKIDGSWVTAQSNAQNVVGTNSAGVLITHTTTGSWTGVRVTGGSNVSVSGILGIFKNGTRLHNGSINGFHLDFSNSSSNASLGYDAAGSNNWTVNNLTAPGGDVDYASMMTQQSNGGWFTNGEPDKAFDGLLTTSATTSASNNNGNITFTPSPSISYTTSVRAYWRFGNVGSTYSINGGTATSITASGWITLASGSGTLTSLNTYRGGDGLFFSVIEVDGTILLTSTGSDNDSLLDSPTDYDDGTNIGGNFATLNPLINAAGMSNGNLDYTNQGANVKAFSTIAFNSSDGPWYWEVDVANGGTGCIGFSPTIFSGNGTAADSGYNFDQQNVHAYLRLNGSNQPSSHSGYTGTSGTGSGSGDNWGMGVSGSNWKIWKNGSLIFNGDVITQTGDFFAWIGAGGGGAAAWSINFGQRPFSYPQTGYKPICTQSLLDPLIADPSEYFDTTLYTGNGSTQTVSGLSMSPDLVWLKSRSSADNHSLFDTVRGAQKGLHPNLSAAQWNDPSTLTGFTSDGWTMAGHAVTNANNQSYVGWAWDGGDLVTNSAYNQSEVWSDGWVLDSGSSWISVPELSFDGFTGTNTTQTRINGGATWTAGTAVPFTTSLRIWGFDAGSGSIEVNGTDVSSQVQDGTSGWGWNTITGITSPLSTIRITGTTANTCGIGAVEVDGKVLVDKGVIPIGSLNSSVYNQSQTWSNSNNISGSPRSASDNYGPPKMFNGILASESVTGGVCFSAYSGNSSMTWTSPVTFSNLTSLRLWVDKSGTGTGFLRVNGNNYDSSVTDGWVTIPETSLSTIQFGYTGGLNTATGVGGVEVNGILLVDSGVTGLTQYPSIASTCRANPTAGMSIVSWTGNSGIQQSISHNLNAAPELIIAKNRSSNVRWAVYHKEVGPGNTLVLNDSTVPTGGTGVWGNIYPTSSVFYVSNDSETNANSANYIAYCFAPVEGYSSFGKYEASSSGPFVYTSFRPALIICKSIDQGQPWQIYDAARGPYNVIDEGLQADNSNAEYTGTARVDFLSNGFKIRAPLNYEPNVSGMTYVYMAWAENLFKYARAR